ncbi:MAG: hypothetical protein PHI27_09505 [Eubacteriales bacterium]|nr:hypothetical protein [Eubacteriales bacterium]MDD3882477.1 hypothetical protein [Eubacteriales bacterium]MDD4513199.1 hypothetical protein [Eubacteriales bacterium]
MQVYVLVLNKTECLEKLLEKLTESGVHGATVIDSTGGARLIQSLDDAPMFAMIRHMLNPERQMNKTIFIVLEDEQVAVVRKIVNDVVGGLNQPDTGIAFTVPALTVEGMAK